MVLPTRRIRPVLTLVVALVALTPAVALAAPAHRVDSKLGRSVVTGGIIPCSGLPPHVVHGLPRYAAGTVTVLQGRVTWRNEGHGIRMPVFPRVIVARDTVVVNSTYRFTLFPGHYVLVARLPHASIRPYVQIDVKEGVTVHANIPNMCK